MFRPRSSIAITLAVSAIAAAAVATVASGGSTAAPYNTSQAAMVTFVTTPTSGAATTSTADAIISVGDTIGGYTFESIPDGVAVYPRGNGRADVFVNHETSTVPFPFNSPWPQGAGVEANQNDFTNSEVSQLNFNQHEVTINSASKAIAEPRELPAVLLELPGNSRRGLQEADPLHERRGPGLGLPVGDSVARPDVRSRRVRPVLSKPVSPSRTM